MKAKPPPSLSASGEATEESVEALKAEIVALRARVAELESAREVSLAYKDEPLHDAWEQGQRSEEVYVERILRDNHYLLGELIDNSPSIIFIKDLKGRNLMVNRRCAEFVGRPREEILGKTNRELFPPDVAAALDAQDHKLLAGGQVLSFEETLRAPNSQEVLVLLTIKFPLYSGSGKLAGFGGIATDITALRRSEAERADLQEKVIEAQRALLSELSTPLVPIADGVLAMPIVGAIDSPRAQQILLTLLEGIRRERAHTAILDITGVRIVDAQVASALASVARAARLLGARVLITGIRPEVARTLVELSADLSGIVTLGTLKTGIAHALGR